MTDSIRLHGFAAVVVLASTVLVPASLQAANVACGDILSGTSVVLDGNVGPCATSHAISVINGAKLDLNGFTVSCDGSTGSVGVTVAQGSTLRNGIVTGCEFTGVQVSGSKGSLLEHVIARDNPGAGISVFSTDASTLRNNAAAGNGTDGFFVATAGSKLVSNVAWDNGTNGFLITAAVSSSGNRSTGNFNGFRIDGNGGKFKNDVAIANGSLGFIVNGDGNSLKKVIGDSTGYGVYLSGNENDVVKAVLSGNSNGVYITGDGNLVSGSRVLGGGGAQNYGLRLGPFADNNVIKKNHFWGHGTADLASDVVTCGSNVFSGNAAATRTDACMQ